MNVVQLTSDAEIETQKASASVKTSNDNLVNYTVQTLASGQNYVTVLS